MRYHSIWNSYIYVSSDLNNKIFRQRHEEIQEIEMKIMQRVGRHFLNLLVAPPSQSFWTKNQNRKSKSLQMGTYFCAGGRWSTVERRHNGFLGHPAHPPPNRQERGNRTGLLPKSTCIFLAFPRPQNPLETAKNF